MNSVDREDLQADIREDLKEYLHDNLEIQLDMQTEFGPVQMVRVNLSLEGKVISQDEFELPEASNE